MCGLWRGGSSSCKIRIFSLVIAINTVISIPKALFEENAK
jgi:hypothetical protein